MVQGHKLLPCSCTILLCSHRSLSVILPCVAWNSRSLQSSGRFCLTVSTHVFLSAPLCLISFYSWAAGPPNPTCISAKPWPRGKLLWLGMGFGHICGKWMEVPGVGARWRVLGLWGSWGVMHWVWAPKQGCPNPEENLICCNQKHIWGTLQIMKSYLLQILV